MKNKIIYVGFYNHQTFFKENRCSFPAATNKINYMLNLLERLDMKVDFFTCNWTMNKKCYPAKTYKISENINIHTLFTISWSNRFFKSISSRIIKIQLFFRLLKDAKKNSTVIVYHSIFYSKLIILLKKIRRFNLILEVEELYQDINNLTFKEILSENEILKLADKFIYVNELMPERISSDKPYIVISGDYQIKKRNHQSDKFHDNKTHIVYAGIIDSKKMGAFTVLDIAKILDEKYAFHILGFGNINDIKELNNKINSFNLENPQKRIIYEGLLEGELFNNFLQKCDIGLSCQNPNGKYNDSSFPSKILTYLTNGLEVVTIDLPVVKNSKVNDIVNYYHNLNVQEISNTINCIIPNKHKISIQLKKIDQENLDLLRRLLNEKNI